LRRRIGRDVLDAAERLADAECDLRRTTEAWRLAGPAARVEAWYNMNGPLRASVGVDGILHVGLCWLAAAL